MQNLTEKGLSNSEVEKLRKQYGLNEIEERGRSLLVRIFKKIVGPIPIMIETALLLSIIAGRLEDFIVIAALFVVNISVDLLQEQKARNALEVLKEKLALTTLVIRNGKFITIDAKDLVPGDIIQLSVGDIVPADAVLLEGSFIQVDQSVVTGESLPVERRETETIFTSSVIQTGTALAKVTATGRNSSLGKNANLVAKAAREKESHFQKAILNIGKFLIIISSILIIIVLYVLISRGNALLESVQFVLVLAIASIPVALPAVLSVTMAIGASTLAKKRTIVSHFQSVEELAGVDQLCVDKTGTLTKNILSVSSVVLYDGFDESLLFEHAILAMDTNHMSKTEQAIYEYAKKNLNISDLLEKYTIENLVPFDPKNKLSKATVRDNSGDLFTVTMGAPQILGSLLEKNDYQESFIGGVRNLAEKGFRIIAVIRQDSNGSIPVGLIPLFDPLRDDAKEIVSNMRDKGIQVRMLTGDSAVTASFVAHKLGIKGKIFNPEETHFLLSHDKLGLSENNSVFAEVLPEDKYHIVEAFQRHDHIVAMTGDGINDAPALKKADVGIAVAGATPVARSAADIILLDQGLSVIRDAIYYARMTFSRMQSYALFRISETIRVVLFITLSILAFNYIPISAIMIIMLALLNDIPVMSIAYDNASVHDKPVRWNLNETMFISVLLGVSGVISSFALLYWLNVNEFALATIQTIIFLKLDVAGHSTLYLTRTGRKNFWEKPFPSLKFFIPAFSSRILGTLIAFLGVFMKAISWKLIIFVWVYSTGWFLVNNYIKVLGYKIFDKFSRREFASPKLATN